MTEHKALRSLLVDRDQIDESRLAAALQGRLSLDERTGDLVAMKPFEDLKAHQKLLCVLLSRLVSEILELPGSGPASPKELIAITGLRSGTVYPSLRRLTEENIASQDSEGRYFIPRSRVIAAIDGLPQGES